MAGAADADDLGVVDRGHRSERNRAVAVFTDIACLHVRRTFAGRRVAIMTSDAVSEYIGVVESCRQPACCIVTIFALIPG